MVLPPLLAPVRPLPAAVGDMNPLRFVIRCIRAVLVVITTVLLVLILCMDADAATGYRLTVYGYRSDTGHMASLGSVVFILPEDTYPTREQCVAAGERRQQQLQAPIQPGAAVLLAGYTCEEKQ